MRIYFFHKVSPPFNYNTISGGAERVILQLAKYISNLGHQSIVINSLSDDFYDGRASVQFLSTQKTLMPWIMRKIGANNNTVHVLGGLSRLRSSRTDIFHSTTAEVFKWKHLFYIKSKLNILHIHDSPITMFSQRSTLNPFFVKKIDVYIAPSLYIARELSRINFVERDKIRIIPNGINARMMTNFPRIRGGNTVLFVGSIVPQKGVHVLIDAMRMVRRVIPDSELVIVGSQLLWNRPQDDSYARSIMDNVRNLSYVHYAGLVSEEQKVKLYRSAKVCVVPSIYGDPFNLVTLESQAAGLPVIASRIGGIPELIKDGVTGILVNPGDASELADRIIRILTDEELWQKISRNAQLHGQRYDWIYVGKQFLELYLTELKGTCGKI